MLEAGEDSKNLRILASLSKPLYSSEVESYFQRIFKDLGWSFPEPEEALRLYACNVAKEIASGILPVPEGSHELYNITRALGYPSNLPVWFPLDDLLDDPTYESLSSAEIEEAIKREAEAFAETCA
jgi:hypothetical protein